MHASKTRNRTWVAPSSVSNLVKQGLIDAYHFFVNPSILGAGMPIFQGVDNRYGLQLQ